MLSHRRARRHQQPHQVGGLGVAGPAVDRHGPVQETDRLVEAFLGLAERSEDLQQTGPLQEVVRPPQQVLLRARERLLGAGEIPEALPGQGLGTFEVVAGDTYDAAQTQTFASYISKYKGGGVDVVIGHNKPSDAILITRELVKQRWNPMAVLSMGPGWYEDQYLKTLGKLADGPLSFVPWYDPNKKLTKQLEAAHAKAFPDINLNTNHVYTFEALLVAASCGFRGGPIFPAIFIGVAIASLPVAAFGTSPTLAVAVGEESNTVEEVCEPFLVRAGMIARSWMPFGSPGCGGWWRLAWAAPSASPSPRTCSRCSCSTRL